MATTPPAVADTVSDPRSDVLYNVRKQLLQHFRGDNLDSSRLTFVKHLGAGEFGRVDQYDYLDKNNVKVKLALKLLNRDLLCNENDVRNFINEMRTLRRLNHPTIAAYAGTGIITAESHDPGKGPTGKMEEHVYLAQECCEGETMQDLILRQMKCRPGTQLYKWSEVVEWMIAVSSALNYMHTNKPMVIHRDLKPANLIIIDKGEGLREIKLVDFGLHKIIHLHSEESIRGAGRSGRGPGGSVRGPGGSVRGGSQNNSGHSSGKSGLNASMEAMLHLSTASRKNKSAHDAVWQEMLKAGADMHTGTNGSVHARNTFSGLQDIGYEMTGGCGSLIYMAPEVHRGEQYNHAVDMFAIALIFWEFFAFRMQLTMVGFGTEEGTSFEAVQQYTLDVCCGNRPPLPKMWPKELRTLFADMWVQNYTKRPSFEQILPRLKDIRGLVLDLEAKGTCPSFRGVLPGMTLAPPKPEKQPSFMKKLKSMLKK
eukprot:jgi/Tetstr1/425511/TSEL_015957.t1